MISNIRVLEDKVEFTVDIWLSRKIDTELSLKDIREEVQEHLPSSHFISYSECFHHGVKFHIVDMNGFDPSPEAILIRMESFINESRKIVNLYIT